MDVTSPSSEEGRPATRRRSAPRSSAARSSASRRSRSSAARACASGASRPRRGCRPRTRSTTRARRSPSSASGVAEPSLDFGTVVAWKDAVVEQMTGGVASLFKANGVEWVNGKGRFTGAERDRGRGRGGRRFQERDRRHRLVPDPAADPGARLAALRRLDRAPRPDRGARAAWSSSAAGSSAASSRRSSTASAAR